MALFGAQTPRELNYELPPQNPDLFVSDDDASAVAVVRALVPGAAAAEGFEVKRAARSRHRFVVWGARSEAEHAFVRVFRGGGAARLSFELRCDVGEAVGPRCLGRFGNGQLEEWLVILAERGVDS